MPTKTCAHCQEPFYVSPSRDRIKYCCQATWKECVCANPECPLPNRKFKKPQSLLKNKRNYCSDACRKVGMATPKITQNCILCGEPTPRGTFFHHACCPIYYKEMREEEGGGYEVGYGSNHNGATPSTARVYKNSLKKLEAKLNHKPTQADIIREYLAETPNQRDVTNADIAAAIKTKDAV